MDLLILLLKAKSGDKVAKLQLISKYKPLIYKLSISIKLKNYEIDDLIQLGSLSILKAIDKFDVNKNTDTIDAYMIHAIRNNYNYLIRGNKKENTEVSLTVTIDGSSNEIIDLVEDPENLEELVVNNIFNDSLSEAIKNLNSNELELLNHAYLDNTSSLTQYCRLKKINYYEGRKLCKQLINKLRNLMLNEH